MAEFIRKRGVTVCPSFGTKEFAEINIAREKAREELNKQSGARWVRNRKAAIRHAMRQPR